MIRPISNHNPLHNPLRLVALAVIFAALASCARLGERMDPHARGPGRRPDARAVVAALRENGQRVRDLRATGFITVTLPDQAGRRQLRGEILFSSPDMLHITGRHRATGRRVFTLAGQGDDYILELPTEGDVYFRRDGLVSPGTPFEASPAELARSFLDLPEGGWRMEAWDAGTGEAVLRRDEGARTREVRAVGGPEWVVSSYLVFDARGEPVARVDCSDYRETDGVRVPSRLEGWFGEEVEAIVVDLRRVYVNPGLEPREFALDWTLIP